MSTATVARRPPGVALLGAQTTALGLLSGFVIIPASALFLAEHGPRALPFVYLAIAATAALLDPVLTRAMRAFPVTTVAAAAFALEVVLIGATFVGLEVSGASWLSVVLQILFPIEIQVGFVLIGAQAGRMLTVRQMKEHFPLVVAGFSAGFLLAGLVAPLLLDVLGGTERLVAVTTMCAAGLLALVLVTARRHGTVLRAMDAPPPEVDDRAVEAGARTRRLEDRFVVLLFAYQMLSALGTQLGDYLVYDRAAARYRTSEDLARFVSVFSVVLNVVALVFVAFIAGRILQRRGMRVGLPANPALMSLFVLVGLVGGASAGVGSMLMFVALGAARVSDIALTDGMTRTSINVAYQGLSPHRRAATQARVEGLGVPLAIGMSGVVLLVVQRVLDGGVLAVTALTAVVCVVWTVLGDRVYRGYRLLLRELLRRRTLVAATGDDVAVAGAPLVDLEVLRAQLEDAAAEPARAVRARRAVRSVRLARHDLQPPVVDLLVAHVLHPVPEVGRAVLQTLAHGDPAELDLRTTICTQVLRHDAARLVPFAHALDALDGAGPAAVPLVAALDDEVRLLRARALDALGLIMSAGAVARAAQWLQADDARLVSAAVEALEVNAPPAVRGEALALLLAPTDRAAARDRLQRLARSGRVPAAPVGDLDDVLAALARDRGELAHRPWLRTCAVHVAGALGRPGAPALAREVLDLTAEGPGDRAAQILRETALAVGGRPA